MHFEMELENTRRIIQSVCKKLNELEKQSEWFILPSKN
jgi:hypothetical protein